MEQRQLIAVLEANLTRHLHWIGAADSKAAFAFTMDTAMLGVLAAVAPQTSAAWSIPPAIAASFAAALLLASLLFVSISAFPRTEGPKGSLIYFGGVSGRDLAKFKGELRALTDDGYLDDLASQCHRNAEIATRKYRWVQRSLLSMYMSVLPWAVALCLLFGRTDSLVSLLHLR